MRTGRITSLVRHTLIRVDLINTTMPLRERYHLHILHYSNSSVAIPVLINTIRKCLILAENALGLTMTWTVTMMSHLVKCVDLL